MVDVLLGLLYSILGEGGEGHTTSAASVQVAPSYGLSHDPLMAAQLLDCTTLVPSRFKTTSRVL